ncbi:hypothetical protein [Kineococcus aurantiacus]|uniref:Uncharacterized protein n=1 Tax=Kineococcus aurantiacus TaxID=37633 RepID=A0A7Y9DQ40_9ACTN|nr:hypothetical protein [Kineococcus aurantiacus]NYD24678.1 hypothetical protein [Kineococcus aurantiacus]
MQPQQGWRTHAEESLRHLAAVTLAGAASGVLIAGVGARLAMMLLAHVNPFAHGLVSDDGFVIGRLTFTGTVNLLAVGGLLGLLGGAVCTVLRGVMIGPRWFRVVSVSAGAAVVVGEMLLHTSGVDFVALEPAALSIALFIAIPGLYAATLTLLAERWLRPGAWFRRARLQRVAPLLLIWVLAFPLLPLLAGLALLWGARELLRRSDRGASSLDGAVLRWLPRTALAAVFCWSGARLASEAAVLI